MKCKNRTQTRERERERVKELKKFLESLYIRVLNVYRNNL